MSEEEATEDGKISQAGDQGGWVNGWMSWTNGDRNVEGGEKREGGWTSSAAIDPPDQRWFASMDGERSYIETRLNQWSLVYAYALCMWYAIQEYFYIF